MRERREGREGMAADVGRDVRRAEFALHQLERREHRPLRAAGAEGRRARRQRARARRRLSPCARSGRAPFRATVSASMPCGCAACRKAARPSSSTSDGVFAGLRQQVLAVHLGLDVGAAQLDVDRLLDVVGLAFLDHQHGALAGAEFADLLRHQRIDHVEHQHRHARGAERVGEAERSSARSTLLVQAALHDDADVVESPAISLVELVLADEVARRRQALLDLQLLLAEGHRRMRQPAVVEARRAGELVEPGDDAACGCPWRRTRR